MLQGGLRWESINLLTQGANVVINKAGFVPSVDILPFEDLPGTFSSSNSVYDDVWKLGTTAVQAACVDAGSQKSTWEMNEQGVFVRGQNPPTSAKGVSFSDYTLEFRTLIATGGTGWRVASAPNGGFGAYFVLTATHPDIPNTAQTMDRNTLTVGYGWSIVDMGAGGLVSKTPVKYPLNFEINEQQWYTIKTVIRQGFWDVYVDDQQIASVDTAANFQGPFGWSTGSFERGTFGFSPFINQAAFYQNVTVTDSSGNQIYSNSMLGDDILAEYGVQTNKYSTCLDGAKRDRNIWIGDFAHTNRIIQASTGRYDYIKGMLQLEFDMQLTSGDGAGLVPEAAYQGEDPEYKDAYWPSNYSEDDYQFFFLLVVSDYFRRTGDTSLFAGTHWDQIKTHVQKCQDRWLDSTTNYIGQGTWFTAGANWATAPTSLFGAGVAGLVPLANALGDTDASQAYTQLSQNIGNAVNTKGWSDSLGQYALGLNNTNDYSLLSLAFPIKAGWANTTQITTAVNTIQNGLFATNGYKDSTPNQDGVQTLSPNTQGFLLDALFIAVAEYGVDASVVTPLIKTMAEEYWPVMVNNDAYFTGASWEYARTDGTPHEGGFTSLSHPWGGAPTYVYSDYILGVRTSQKSDGTIEWIMDPVWSIIEGLDLTWVNGTVPLPDGGQIVANWSIDTDGTITSDASVKGSDVTITVKPPPQK